MKKFRLLFVAFALLVAPTRAEIRSVEMTIFGMD
jgi:hypothetical protein